ncbi:FxsA family protein [Psychromonas sp. 14N.309.X.WAT.B.A12]|uniref:FxsA family protein n=1 Tax=unclassified Psychromonas TaxID=2614957 RepID=UPI0025AF0015|nr:FxsA family protein [Psychromonas sp. 14N.309.X.WAT.B.A12]MDN2663833.1 FxsA family protein [Psychromonas sp. 14N.309.X.WAT.B.A12]
MFARLFLIFTGVSLLEIFVLVKVGGFIGAWPTISLVILTALIGSALVRSQGLQLIQKVQQRMAEGEMPGQQLIEGMMLIVTGILLVTPGFVTDITGLLLLQPTIRGNIAKLILANVKFAPQGTMGGFSSQGFTRQSASDDTIIEGEFERREEKKLD